MYHDYEARQYIGQRVRLLREEKGLTLEQLGEIVDMRPKAIQRVEDGKYSVGIELLQRIVEAMGGNVSVVW